METRPIDTGGLPVGCPLTEPELRAVKRHQQRLSQDAGHGVEFEAALGDWLENCAQEWRQARLRDSNLRQCQEILRHKWLESEKANRDLGKEAVLDWIANHAAQWREWYENQVDEEVCG